MSSEASGRLLAPGARLLLRSRSADAQELGEVRVASVRDGLIWFAGGAQLHANDRIVMEHRLEGDACYRAPARVERVPPETLALRRTGEWERVQRRSEVRIRLYRARLDLRPPPPSNQESVSLELLDLSAGGFSGRTRGDLGIGRDVQCRLDLGDRSLDLRAVVVRGETAEHGFRVYGFRFHPIDEAQRSALRAWVLREGVRRARRDRLSGG